MHRSERFGLVLALPGLALAATIFVFLTYRATVCDPLYEPNRLLDIAFLSDISHSVASDLDGHFEPPSRPDLKLARNLPFPASCCRTP